MPKLTVVPPSEPGPTERVRLRIKRAPKPAAMLQCHRCGGREVIQTKTGVMVEAGKAKGGTRQLLCAACFARGDRVVLA
jgi:hypothetical protein